MNRACMVSVGLMLLVSLCVSQTTRRVPQDYATIQAAINAAVNGDTVLVAEGTYLVNLKLAKKIVLASHYLVDGDTSHISKTILDGGSPAVADSGSVIIVGTGTDSTTQITGFTIRNGRGTKQLLNGVNWRGGFGIYIAAGAARISHNIITGNSFTSSEPLFGGGVAVVPTPGPLGEWIIEHNRIISNHLSTSVASTNGGIEGSGLRLSSTGRATHNVIYNNSVTATGGSYAGGGGIYAGSFAGFALASMPSTQVDLANNEIRGNSSNGDGGWGGGIGAVVGPGGASTVSTKLSNNIISGNVAAWLGSAIHFNSGSHVLISNSLADHIGKNAIEVQSGRAVLTFLMLNCILWNPNAISEFTTGGGSYPKSQFYDYNLVRGGMTGTGNINTNPLFVVGDTLYHLQNTSPCIGAGATSANLGGVMLYAPTTDFFGQARPFPYDSKSDMGAIENEGGKGTRRVPQDYATIQAAINAAVNGDTVLVAEGVYFENLFLNKSIMLASLFASDGNKEHINRTILDGSKPRNSDSASVIIIGPLSDTNTVVQGFTIQKGAGTKAWGFVDNTFWLSGGGIYMVSRGAHVLDNHIINNSLTGTTTLKNVFGGGIGIADYDGVYLYPWVIADNIVANNSIVGNQTEDAGISATGIGIIRDNIVMGNSADHNAELGSGSVYGAGITVRLNANVNVDRNYIAKNTSLHNGSGLYLYAYNGLNPTVRLTNNIIAGNRVLANAIGGTIFVRSGEYEFVNNTIADNSGGTVIRIFDNRGPLSLRMMNNISYNPGIGDGLEISYAAATVGPKVHVAYNCTKAPTGIATNIVGDPQFVIGDTLYHLQNTSPCIGAGATSANVGGVTLYAPTVDFFETIRPRDVSTNPDMGAVENDLPTAVDVTGETKAPTAFALDQNFPNPFNPTTTIRFALPRESNVRLAIFNLLGQKIEELVNEQLAPGVKQVTWDAKVPTGVYMYRLDVVGSNGEMYTETRRMTVLK